MRNNKRPNVVRHVQQLQPLFLAAPYCAMDHFVNPRPVPVAAEAGFPPGQRVPNASRNDGPGPDPTSAFSAATRARRGIYIGAHQKSGLSARGTSVSLPA
jgi:hypothetical protein